MARGMTGKRHSPEAREKMRIAKLGKRISPATEFKKGQKNPYEENRIKALARGEKHHNWKGDLATYGSKHDWIERHGGKPSLCERCGTKESKRFMWHNVSHEYKRELSDWERLCSMCHAHEHKNWEKQKSWQS